MRRWSVERFLADQELLENLTDRFLDIELWQKPRDPLTTEECGELRRKVAGFRHPQVIEEICAIAAIHPRAEIRRSIMEAIEPFLTTHPAVRELVVWLLGDDEDFVVFSAARLAGRNRIGEAYEELEHITGPAKAALFRSTKPVGIGAAIVGKAMAQIMGATDRAARCQGEEEYDRTGRLPQGARLGEFWDYDPGNLPRPAGADMVLIPASEFTVGIGIEDIVHPIYDVDDAVPRQTRY